MPALKKTSVGISCITRAVTSGDKSLWKLKGREGYGNVSAIWLGFICEAGIQFIPGKHCKIIYQGQITWGYGTDIDDWKQMQLDEYLLGWCVSWRYHDAAPEELAVYAIVDKDGFPITVHDRK